MPNYICDKNKFQTCQAQSDLVSLFPEKGLQEFQDIEAPSIE